MRPSFRTINRLQCNLSALSGMSLVRCETTYTGNPNVTTGTFSGGPTETGPINPLRKMSGWQIHEYGGVEILQCSDGIKIPPIKDPNDVLIEVNAASINPIDIAMMGGYGSALINTFRTSQDIEFPLTLGRDFCGVVKQRGMSVREELKIGDKVWGVVPLHRPGSHAQYVTVNACNVAPKPKNLSVSEAAAILYAGLTAWSGLFITGQLGGLSGALTSQGGGRGKKICIMGGSGGVGSMALQIAKAENLYIVVSCSPDAFDMVQALGADQVIDYTAPDAIQQFCTNGPYDIILDCAGKGAEYATQIPWKYDQYITFTSPVLRNIDNYGLAVGLLKNLYKIVENNVQSMTKQRALTKWAYFVPAPQGIHYLQRLVENNKLKPVVDSTFDFNQTVQAYQKVADGNLRGKVVINIK